MDLLVDVQALQTPSSGHRGIGRYARNLLAALAKARPHWHIEIAQNGRLDPLEDMRSAGLPILTFRPPLAIDERNAGVNELHYGDWLCAHKPRCMLILSPFEREGVNPWFIGSRPPLACVLYDLIPLVFSNRYLDDRGIFTWYARQLRRLSSVDAVMAISECSANDFRRFFPDATSRLLNIRGATEPTFVPSSVSELQATLAPLTERLALQEEFFLYVGGDDFRKNMAGALQTFACLPEDCRRTHDLVLVCYLSSTAREWLEKVVAELGISAHVKLTGFVTDLELRALYQRCRLFLFPSLYEGMGLPVLEALHCGAPVVASNVSSIPEYAGPISWLADARSPQALARAVLDALAEPRDARLPERLAFASTFGWEKSAELAAGALDDLCSARRSHSFVRPRRRRIAFVSPMPPCPSGISDYSAELLEPLKSRFEIELVVDPAQAPVGIAREVQYRVLRPDELIKRHAAVPYELFVYQMGNSHYHTYMLDLLRRFHGLVVLHDYYLGGMLDSARSARHWTRPAVEELEYEGELQFADWLRTGAIANWALHGLAPLNRRVLELASAVVVHSGWAWQRLRRTLDTPVFLVPQIMPLPSLKSRREERLRLGLPLDSFLICTLGHLGHSKRIDMLLRAVAQLPAAIRTETRLVLVGTGSPEFMALMLRLSGELGIADLLHFTHHVSLSDFSAHARAADVCVQLRYPTHGETSAALLRAMAAGAACVTSDQGPMAEIPDHVTWKVRTPQYEVPDLVAALQRLHNRPELGRRLGAAAENYVRDRHSLERVAAHYALLIEEASSSRDSIDENWRDHAVSAVADACDPSLGQAFLESWLTLRRQAGRPRMVAPGLFHGSSVETPIGESRQVA